MRIFKSVLLAVPVYFLWNFLAPLYLVGLPEQFLNVPFWHIAGLFVLINLLRRVLFPRLRNRAFLFGQGLGHGIRHGFSCQFRRQGRHGHGYHR